jgi:alanine racemase
MKKSHPKKPENKPNMPKAKETLLEIDLNALDHNYRYLISKIDSDTKVMAMVKAFAYGSDSVVIAKELVDLGVDYLGVAYPKEGKTLRDAGIEIPIMVLHPLPAHFELIVNRCLEPSIYSRTMLKEFISFAESKAQKAYPIHLKFNTGLNRLGFKKDDIPFLVETLSKSESIKVKSAFSHLAVSEDLNEKKFTMGQIDAFKKISEALVNGLGYAPIFHTANTSGIINYPEAHFNMVRPGIGLYGFGNDAEESKHLIPIGTLKTVISQIQSVNPGESVGYNRVFIAKNTTRFATLPIGYADGIPRAYGEGKGWVTINGERAAILGDLCMDMMMVDVTHIDCEEGDEAVIFGPNASAEALSAAIGSISYELITGVSQRVKRIVCRK